MNKVLLCTALLVSVAATQAVAGPKWNQASLAFSSTDFGGVEDAAGFGISGTKLLNSNFFVAGSYTSTTVADDISYNVDLDVNSFSLGLGARKAVAPNTDIFGVVSYEYLEAEFTSGYYYQTIGDASGYGLSAGFRSMISPKFELSGVLSYKEIEDVSGSGFGVGASYYFTEQFAAGLAFSTFEDEDTVGLSGTMNF